jgi:hypothetical protein
MSIKDQAIHLPCFFLNILTYECTLIDPLLLNVCLRTRGATPPRLRIIRIRS